MSGLTPITFETFPFPKGILKSSKKDNNPFKKAISEIAKELYLLRQSWLNPSDLVLPTIFEYGNSAMPVDKKAEIVLKNRTLTNLYNDMPTWLQKIHSDLDEAVAKAYAWPSDLDDKEVMNKLFLLNQSDIFE